MQAIPSYWVPWFESSNYEKAMNHLTMLTREDSGVYIVHYFRQYTGLYLRSSPSSQVWWGGKWGGIWKKKWTNQSVLMKKMCSVSVLSQTQLDDLWKKIAYELVTMKENKGDLPGFLCEEIVDWWEWIGVQKSCGYSEAWKCPPEHANPLLCQFVLQIRSKNLAWYL